MKSWTDFHIAIVYFAGLFVALASGIIIVQYLRPFKVVIRRLVNKFETLWTSSFVSTTILAGLLGAMAISFRDCDGSYDYLLSSKRETVLKGFEQVSNAFVYLAIVLGLWLFIFMVLRMTRNKKNLPT